MAATNPTVGDTQMFHDALGRPVTKTETGGTKTDAIGGASQSYTYDDLNELTKVTDGTGTTSFTYDANHNRQTMVALNRGGIRRWLLVAMEHRR